MRTLRWLPMLLVAWAFLSARPLAAADPDVTEADEQALKAARIDTDGPSLLDFFRRRTLSDADRDRVQKLIEKLGDDSFTVREQASSELVKLDNQAVALLRRAASENPDIEVVRRAERCLQQIDQASTAALSAAAARLLVKRKPAGAVEVLLAYLPFAEEESVIEEVRAALVGVAMPDGKPHAALVQALQDANPLKRGAAAEALVRAGGAEERKTAHRLLSDRELTVRLRVALALVESKDRQGIPVLIALLGELPQSQAWHAEELLFRLAGDQAPAVSLGSDDAARKQCSEAWSAWWRDHAEKIDLSKLDLAQRLLGYTLIVQMDRGLTGRVLEIGPDSNPRWKIEGLMYPVDAQVVPGNRVLIAEYRGGQVSERDFQGTIRWTKRVASPIGCQRLPNGHTFIAARNQLLEVDRTGTEVLNIPRPTYDIMSARRFADGKIALLTSGRTCVLLGRTGQQLKSFPVGQVQMYSGFDVLPNNAVLVPQLLDNRVVEYDADGKKVWEASVPNPTSAMRLPNGHTLAASMSNHQVVELDRDGKQVWSYKADGRPWRARRR